VRTDSSFVELTVGDPDVADVNPLTDRSLSILGKKNGTTRVSAYAEGKKLIGVFDVEVVYDTSLLQTEIRRRFPHAGLRVSAVNGRIMLSGSAPDGPTVDKAVLIAKQFGPDVINSVNVLAPQQVMLEVRFVEATRQAGRDLGVQWNVFGQRNLANIGNRTPSAQLPITNTNPNGDSRFSQPGQQNGGPNIGSGGLGISPVVVAGVLSGTAPFGVMVSKLLAAGVEPISSSTRWNRRASPARWRAQSSLRCPATPRASSPAASIRSRCPARSAPSPSTTSATAWASPSRRRC
jgi:pilus assembly protein CpaC